MHPEASAGPSPSIRPHSHPVGTRRGNCSTRAPISSTRAASHPVKSNRGAAVAAVEVSSAAVPHRAWFATACAGQRPVAAGASPSSQRAKLRSSPVSAGLPVDCPGARPRSSP